MHNSTIIEPSTSKTGTTQLCPSCSTNGAGNYCAQCGAAYKVKRISLHMLFHDVFHLFTHLDKGFALTVKQLIRKPGTMQRQYIDGDRYRHQKPFSMFFICATIAGLSRYWVISALIKYYGTGDQLEANFFHHYMLMLHMVLLPFYSFITYLLFYKERYNYAEVGVCMLYNVSAFFLIVSVIALSKFIWPQLDTAYIEFPILFVYNTVTMVHFFNKSPRYLAIIKSILVFSIVFLSAHYLEKLVISLTS